MRSLLIVAMCLASAGGPALTDSDHGNVAGTIKKAFDRRGLRGAFVMLRKTDDGRWETFTSGPAASKRSVPASTFKIPNSLIGLETGVLSAEHVFKWDGKPRQSKAWEQDLTLPEALRVSCVPCYQEVARGVGASRMKQWLAKLKYGNADIGDVVDRFWLDGPLTISPVEQADFVRQLYEETLPFERRHQQLVKRMLLVEEKNGHRLFAKTGWAQAPEPDVGWYVGWLESGGSVFVFATLVFVNENQPKVMQTVRKDLTLEIFRALGLLST